MKLERPLGRMSMQDDSIKNVLERLTSLGIVRRLPAWKAKVCPKCGHEVLRVVDACSECGSTELKLEGDGLLCTRCGRTYLGVVPRLVCEACGSIFTLEEAASKEVYRYELAEPSVGQETLASMELKKLNEKLEEISTKLDGLLELLRSELLRKERHAAEIALNEKVRKTYNTLLRRLYATSEELASQNMRSRALESLYLNQLFEMGLVRKEKLGRKVYFMIRDDTFVESLRPAVELLRSSGWTVLSPATILGRSGAEHEFVIAASSKGSPERPELVVSLAVGIRPIDEQKVTSFYAKAMDVGAGLAALVALPSLNEKAKELARFYGIRFLEVGERERLGERVLEWLKGIVSKSP